MTGLVVPAQLETDAQVLFDAQANRLPDATFCTAFFTRRGWRKSRYELHAYGTGSNMAFRRDALVQLGGFDPALDAGTVTGGGGDLDVFHRLVEAGGVIAYRPDAVVRRPHPRSWPALQRRCFDDGRGRGAFLAAALSRARGQAAIAVAAAYVRWLGQQHGRRIVRRLLRRGEQLPLRFLIAGLLGALSGPFLYAVSSTHARLGRAAE